jgi:hypothetical protein
MDKFFVRIPVHGYYEYEIEGVSEHHAIDKAELLTMESLKFISSQTEIKGLTFHDKDPLVPFYSTRISPKFTCKCGSTTFSKVNTAERIIQFQNGKFIELSEYAYYKVGCTACSYELNKDEIDQLLKEIKG